MGRIIALLAVFSVVYIVLRVFKANNRGSVNQLNANGGCSSGLIGAGIGFIIGGGPIGAIIGYALGTIFGGSYTKEDVQFMGNSPRQRDFSASLLVLTAAVMKANGVVKKSELDYVKRFFISSFGQEQAEKYILTLREVLKQDIQIAEVSQQIGRYMDYSSRLQLLHYLFGIAAADGQVQDSESTLIQSIANYMGVYASDFDSIKAMFVKQVDDAYTILGIDPSASDDEVKKAYREMAKKNHPDKVAYLGDDVRKDAEKKFQEINDAYDRIKKQRGMN
ncbi:MAG: TerB family tellurite resistance protein [Bacteroidales bacterium]|jgi:DnaJ like chaperone protein|nr:TerB family tellurite resistance protein [Bacteroidales bacterium]